jgi:hypothetical protein
MQSLAQGTALMKSPLERYVAGRDTWHNDCARFVCRFVTGADPRTGSGLGASRPTAWEACQASGPLLSTDHAAAPAGAIGWYRSTGTSPKPGHVVIHLGGDILAMGSDAVSGWGVDSGTCTWSHYRSAKPTMQYVGWTYDYVGQVLTDAKIVVKIAGHPELYLLTSPTTAHHLTPAEWKPFKAKGARAVTISPAALAHYRIAA